MNQGKFDSQYALSQDEISERRMRTMNGFKLRGDELRKHLVRELKWWDEFGIALDWAIEEARADFKRNPKDYFMPLEEIVYYRHWQRQLISANTMRTFINKNIKRLYGQV